MKVETEQDAVPIVRIYAALMRRSLADPAVAKRAHGLKGVVVLKSATDPQTATLRFEGQSILVERGAAPDAGLTITLDLADDTAKPRVGGAARHPKLALVTAKLLEPPIRSWQAEADDFCVGALLSEACPRPLRVVSTDDGEVRQWGGEGEPAIQIHGPADLLASALSGSSVLAEDVLAGKLELVGDLRDLSVLTRFSIDHLFGEL